MQVQQLLPLLPELARAGVRRAAMPVRAVLVSVYVMSGLTAGVAAIITSGRLNAGSPRQFPGRQRPPAGQRGQHGRARGVFDQGGDWGEVAISRRRRGRGLARVAHPASLAQP